MEAQDAGLYYRGIDRIGWTDLVPRQKLRKHGSSQDWSYMEGKSMDASVHYGSSRNEKFHGPLPHTLGQNRLLAALPEEVFERLAPDLEPVRLELGSVLHESGEHLRHIYFPVDSIVSLLCELDDGASGEIAVVGNEGLVGIALIMGGKSTLNRAVVQSAGFAYRIRADILVREFESGSALQEVVLLYTQALITQTSQTAVCNRFHAVEQQLCRWLLMSLDRMPSNELTMTQEVIATNLGVRREGVTVAAGKLQAAGLIQYNRGKITVMDRLKLEQRACECYAVVEKEFDRLLPKRTYRSAMPSR
jgi:CRP-like cAMP-binding protein